MKCSLRLNSLVITATIPCLFFIGCGTGPSKNKGSVRSTQPVEQTENGKSEDAKPREDGGADSVFGFTNTVYPLSVENCGSCHDVTIAPFFAADDANTAHDALVKSNKVNFEEPEKSRLVLRLSEDLHNCWSGDCDADAEEMLAAINEWKSIASDSLSDTMVKTTTNALTLADAQEGGAPAATDTYVWEAEDFISVNAPMQVTDVEGSSGGQVMTVPAGNGGRIVDLTRNDVGFINYQIEIQQAGTYKLYGLMATPDGNADSIFFSIDGAAPVYWTSGVASTDFNWIEAAVGNMRTEYTIDLDVGMHTIQMRRREERAQFDMFALSSNPSFDGGTANVGSSNKQLVFDLESVVGVKGTFRITAAQYDDYSLIFQNPEIQLESENIYVKTIYVLINGKRNPQAATYSIIDKEISAPGEILSEASLVQPFENNPDTDEIQIAFEIIEKR